MSEHYYTKKQKADHDTLTITASLRGGEYSFLTDAGVFSKKRIDRGTRLLIEHMKIKPSDMILDLGCGYGILGIVAARIAVSGYVYLVDINERAAYLTEKNININKISNASVFCGNGFAPIQNKVFDLILSNPPFRAGKKIVYGFLHQAASYLKDGGRITMVARTSQGAKSLANEMEMVYGNVSELGKGGGYRVYESVYSLKHRI